MWIWGLIIFVVVGTVYSVFNSIDVICPDCKKEPCICPPKCNCGCCQKD